MVATTLPPWPWPRNPRVSRQTALPRSPLGAHIGGCTHPPSPSVAHQRQLITPPPIVPPRDNRNGRCVWVGASSRERDLQPPGNASDDGGTDPVRTGAAPPSAEYITSFLTHIRRHTTDVTVDPALDAATPAGTVVGTSRERKRSNASLSGSGNDGAADGGVAVAADVATDVSAVTTDGAACDTQAEPSAGPRKRRRARPHTARDAQRSLIHDGCPPPSPGAGTGRGADG